MGLWLLSTSASGRLTKAISFELMVFGDMTNLETSLSIRSYVDEDLQYYPPNKDAKESEHLRRYGDCISNIVRFRIVTVEM